MDLGSRLPITEKVPATLEATSVHGDCVAGRGVACLDEKRSRAWTWTVPRDALPEPIVSFARLRDDVFVIVDSAGTLRAVHGPTIAPLPFASTARVVTIAGRRAARGLDWVGLTADHHLVSGTTDRAVDCGGSARAAALGPNGFLGVLTEVELLRGTLRGSVCAGPLALLDPPVAFAVGHASCGFSPNPFLLTAAGLYGPPTSCMID